MKNVFCLFILLSFTLFYSCNDSKDMQVPNVNSKLLPGVWELRAVRGGMVVYDPYDYRPGNGSLWIFDSSRFKSIYQDSTWRSGKYAVSRGTGTDLNTERTIDQFIFNDVPAESFELRDDTLRLYYGAMMWDGNIQMYVKVSDDAAQYDLQ